MPEARPLTPRLKGGATAPANGPNVLSAEAAEPLTLAVIVSFAGVVRSTASGTAMTTVNCVLIVAARLA